MDDAMKNQAGMDCGDMPGKDGVPSRQRRVSQSDRDLLKAQLERAAFSLFLEGGSKAISLRAVARAAGVSAMTPYGYFSSKADLLASLWPHILGRLFDILEPIFDAPMEARQKQGLVCEAILDYWEQHPEHYRIVYMTEGVSPDASLEQRAKVPRYRASLEKNLATTTGFACDIGADPSKAAMANDMRFAMLLGFAHATVVTRHFPWTDRQRLKRHYVEQVVRSMEEFLLRKDT
ncbi:TetR/AcrR family transcriptional regulator [Curvibacter sp. APW13]|uniref:TetR/AcrR family transcriptional regulator n=1 Tax=Curvibacter sp. APW13 TaxID=3077236 RepID=UPI0028DD953B|nr:TetR/AcrR family transcriptional regulator [Curvibacter sp. APW13]MDT8991600.1 TetR/AcrR family transcriptional regulator [Curvibacter sp. APW13]